MIHKIVVQKGKVINSFYINCDLSESKLKPLVEEWLNETEILEPISLCGFLSWKNVKVYVSWLPEFQTDEDIIDLSVIDLKIDKEMSNRTKPEPPPYRMHDEILNDFFYGMLAGVTVGFILGMTIFSLL